MAKKENLVKDIHAAGRLTMDAVKGIVDVVESLHQSILNIGGLLGGKSSDKTTGITGMVYNNIRSGSDLAGKGLDFLADWLNPIVKEKETSTRRESILSVLNGVLGDYLATQNSPLAIPMHIRIDGKSIDFHDQLFIEKVAHCKGKILLMIHGSCLNDLQWTRSGHNHGQLLAGELGYLPIYLHYNTGKHISENGKELTSLLEEFIASVPSVKEIIVIAHSMGGLVSRSAVHYGQVGKNQWTGKVKKILFLGTPHHGAPLERLGNWIDNVLEKSAFSRPFSRLGKIRSAGVTDLRYGNVVDEDWSGRDRFQAAGDRRIRVPLPANIACYAIAANTSLADKLNNDVVGDGLVPISSALGKHTDPKLNLDFAENHQWIAHGMGHLDLISNIEVYEKIREWIA